MIQIDIDGNPIPWMRAGIMRINNKNVIYDRQKKDKEMMQWQIKHIYKEPPLAVPLMVTLVFRMPIPKGTSGVMRREMLHGVIHHSKKPDLDNLEKFIFDCMNGLVFVDDKQICSLHATKIYSLMPSTSIRIKPLTSNNRDEEMAKDELSKEILEQEFEDGYYTGDCGSGDLHRDSPNKKGTGTDGRKKDCIVFI